MNCINCVNASCDAASVIDFNLDNCDAYTPNSNLAVLQDMYIEDFAAFLTRIADCTSDCKAWCDGCSKDDKSCKEAWIAWLKKPPVLATKD